MLLDLVPSEDVCAYAVRMIDQLCSLSVLSCGTPPRDLMRSVQRIDMIGSGRWRVGADQNVRLQTLFSLLADKTLNLGRRSSIRVFVERSRVKGIEKLQVTNQRYIPRQQNARRQDSLLSPGNELVASSSIVCDMLQRHGIDTPRRHFHFDIFVGFWRLGYEYSPR